MIVIKLDNNHYFSPIKSSNFKIINYKIIIYKILI